MTEHEMKDDSSRQDEQTARGTSDMDPTATAAGRGYTNPDGSHGFVYNSQPRTTEAPDTRRYRSALIAVSVVLVTVLVVVACLIGGFMAARNLSWLWDEEAPHGSPVEDIETSDGLYISEGTDTLSANHSNAETDAADLPLSDNSLSAESETMGQSEITVSAPDEATIHKLAAQRVDKNKDGRPDVAYDADGNVLTSAGDDQMTVATVVDKVAASVVEITTETIVQSGHIGQYVTSGAGSGVIIAKEGYIVTNHHVIDGANTITVRLNDGTEFPATLIGTDSETDIAVLWINAGEYALTVATIGSSYDLVVGEDIIAIGNPLGSLGGTVTEGMISATEREISVSGVNMTLLQVSAPINPGNSGGGLFNLAGKLVGVVNAKMSSEEIEGLGFAIPSDTAYEVICELIEHGYVRGRPTLDFQVVDVTSSQYAMYYFNSRYTGVYVYDQSHEIVQYGDLIYAADGKEISTVSELNAVIKTKEVGDTLALSVYRSGEKITLEVTLAEYVPEFNA